MGGLNSLSSVAAIMLTVNFSHLASSDTDCFTE